MTGEWQAAELRAFAMDVLADWIDGYTMPEEGPQLRIRPVVMSDSAYLDVRVEECDPFPANERHFRISLTVEAL
ncbi:hypothetical protein ACFRCI_23530 [Streptomyces sp. NPDC056638]|uniref:hypothetical protein n=1 Tax=Streptomyces sp. NPDC056638 TaxID=3345887 RepID=UPI0036ACD7F0